MRAVSQPVPFAAIPVSHRVRVTIKPRMLPAKLLKKWASVEKRASGVFLKKIRSHIL